MAVKHTFLIILAALLAALFIGCSNDTQDNNENAPTNDKAGQQEQKDQKTKKEESRLKGISNEEFEIYESLFDLNNKVTIEVVISDEEIEKLQKDYEKYRNKGSKSPIYRRAEKVIFTIGDKKYEIEDVGIRQKGNTSRRDIRTNGRYFLSHYKLSFKQTFDDENYYGADAVKWESKEARKERKNRTFATLESLEVKWNSTLDSTYTCEVFSHRMFRDMGVLAANNNKAIFKLADTSFGVMTIYEPIDEIFIQRYLPEKDWGGDLYKAAWTNNGADYAMYDSYGVEDEDTATFYNFDLKTNKKKSDFSSIKNLLNSLNIGLDQEKLESVVDMDYFLKFAAACYFAGDPDDIRNNYNNHYVYFKKSDGKAIFIPYDNDRTYGLRHNYDPSGQAMSNVSPFSMKATGANYDRAKVNKIFQFACASSGVYLEDYKAALANVANSKWMTYEYFRTLADIVKNNYENDCVPEHNFHSCDEKELALSETNNKNMLVNDYMTKILKTYEDAVAKLSPAAQ